MIGALDPWWRARSPREQQLLKLLGALAALLLFWLLVVRPLGDALAAAKQRHSDALAELSDIRELVARIEAAEAGGGIVNAGGSAQDAVTSTADAIGLELTSLNAAPGGNVSVAIAAVRPDALFDWLQRLERERGVSVAEMDLRRNTDSSLAADIVFAGRDE